MVGVTRAASYLDVYALVRGKFMLCCWGALTCYGMVQGAMLSVVSCMFGSVACTLL